MNDTSKLIGAMCCVISQLRTIDALDALVTILSQATNAAYQDGFTDASDQDRDGTPQIFNG